MALTFLDVLLESVQAEATAASYYERLQAHAAGPDARGLLAAMAAVQRAHGEQIAAEGRALLYGGIPVDPRAGSVSAHVAPGWDDVRDLSYDEALQIALEGQAAAEDYYAGLATLFDGPEEAMLKRAAAVEQRFGHQLRDAVARRARARRCERALAQIIGSVVVARQSATRMLRRPESATADPRAARLVEQVIAYEEQRSAEIASLSPEPGLRVMRSPAFVVSVAASDHTPPDLGLVMRVALELEEKTASYCTRAAATLRVVEATVLRKLAAECLDNAESIATALARLGRADEDLQARSSDPRLAA